jgi:tetratricopeptide (TPR) repeat protein
VSGSWGARPLLGVFLALGLAAAVDTRALAEPIEPDRVARARQLSDEGRALFDRTLYAEAIAAFKASYALEPKARLWFNIGLAYRRLGDCDQALVFYRRYLAEEPDAFNRARVEDRITEMQACSRAPEQAAPPEPARVPAATPSSPPAPATAAATSVEATARPRRGHRLVVAGAVVAAAGVASLATAVGLSVDAMHTSNTITRLFHDGGDWTAADAQTLARGRNDNIAAGVLYGVGGAALASSVVLLALARRAARAPRIALVPSPNGAVVACAARF